MEPKITVVIPSIPPRGVLLARAINSVGAQTLPAHAISVAIDNDREGAGPTRTRALFGARTEWVAFLDDDDRIKEKHLETLWNLARDTNADVVWSWFEVIGGTDPLEEFRGRQWDPDNPHMFPIVTMMRTELAWETGGFLEVHPSGDISGEDHPFYLKCSQLGGKFAHTPEITWEWYHNTGNTSGLPHRW